MENENKTKKGKISTLISAIGDSVEALVGSLPEEKQEMYKLKYYKDEIEGLIENASKEELEQVKNEIESEESLSSEDKISMINILLDASTKENREKVGVMNHDDYVEYKKEKAERKVRSR